MMARGRRDGGEDFFGRPRPDEFQRFSRSASDECLSGSG
jgi:hypothetical protein